MLPSTGYFKAINCPFYDSGLCERPYCHFRHVKKELLTNTSNDRIESGAILQKLVSAAVQKVLQHTESPTATSSTQPLPPEQIEEPCKINTQSKATYNPTPIAELNKIVSGDTESNDDIAEQRKKHIPVPYTPRKPTCLPIKRSAETNGSSKPFVFNPPPAKYTPGSTDSAQVDLYTPKGTVTESNEKYLPGVEKDLQEYTPNETPVASKHNYIPSDRHINKKKVLEYKPTKVNSKNDLPSVTYQPTPKALVPCFSSDEEEQEPKKPKLSHDFNDLDDLGPEFDILDQILDEEKSREKDSEHSVELKGKHENDVKKRTKSHDNNHRKHKSSVTKSDEKKSKHDSKSEENKKHSSHNKKDTSKSSDKKSHKSSSKDKHKEKNKKEDKDSRKEKSTDKRKKSESKSSDRSSKHSENNSPRHSKHSSSTKHSSSKKDHKSSNHKSDKHKIQKKKKKHDSFDTNECDNTDTGFDLVHEDEYEMSESDEETIALECKRIFEEYVPAEKKAKNDEDSITNKFLDKASDEEYIPGKKRISRTVDQNVKIIPKAPLKPDHKVNAARIMAERLVKVKEYITSTRNSINPSNTDNVSSKPDLLKNTTNITSSKIRIAHVPYASTLVNAKRTMTPNTKTKAEEPSTSTTIVQTVKKGSQRVAHIPSEKFIDRPGVLEPLASKIPANIRSSYLNMMIDECLKIYLTAPDAFARAQHEELATSKKCSTVQIYKNSAVLTVSRLRKEIQECKGVKKSGVDCSTLQRMPQTISGSSGNIGSWSIESKNRKMIDNQQFTGIKFYNNIKKWVLTEEQLQENGFPREHPSGEKGRAVIHGQNKQAPPRGFLRTCRRCKKEYTVDKKGFSATKEECIYHPNNKYRVRGEARYQCCSQDSSSDGCCIAPCHVYEYVDYENLKGYIKTMPPDPKCEDHGVYSLDCEMCYTTHGLDLTRVTVINSACKVVYETLIKPFHPIIDYNTRYSGITEENMANVKTTLLEVQATLLTMFNSKTILVGHSLESDFKALKLIHDTVIDTSVLFPHKMGPPFKRALRNLSSEYLKKIIQNSVEGHDSAEDATVCMELILYKLKEDLKTR